MNKTSRSTFLAVVSTFAMAACSDENGGFAVYGKEMPDASVNDGAVDDAGLPDSGQDAGGDAGPPITGCTRTQGYWKNHPWPVSGLTIGGVFYTRTQLLAILHTPARGNAVIILAYQLIAAELNVASGASPAPLAAIAEADAFFAAHPLYSFVATASTEGQTALAIKDLLEAFNEGRAGPLHCE